MDLLPTGPDSVGPYRLLHRLGTGGQGTVYSDSGVVDGPLLQEWVRGAGPRGGAALERLAVDTVTALAAIHRAEVVHRDVKPGNVLLGPDGPVVIDFGIARALDLNQSIITGQAVGTPGYMAPEQIAEEATGPAADMFAWGATMVFAATGERAFRGGSIPAVMQAIPREEPELHRPTGRRRRRPGGTPRRCSPGRPPGTRTGGHRFAGWTWSSPLPRRLW